MSFQIRKAERTQVSPKIAISGPSGSGKTLTALMVAYGITKDWSKILVIDTENNSAELYANATIKNITKNVGQFDVIPFGPPFSPQRYVEAISCAEQGKYEVVIIDSLSHSWNGSGGALDMVNNSSSINSYAAWKNVTPVFQRMIDKILQSSCTIICTMRAKQEYVMETNDKGKQAPKKVGMAPIIRDGIEYEFTTVFDMNLDHYGFASKDRTGMFNGQLIMDDSTGHNFEQWRLNGSPIIREQAVVYTPTIAATFNHPIAQPPSLTPPPNLNTSAIINTPPTVQPPVNPGQQLTAEHQSVINAIVDSATKLNIATADELKNAAAIALNIYADQVKSMKQMSIDDLNKILTFLNTPKNEAPTTTNSNGPLF
jgi:hypothetical protein